MKSEEGCERTVNILKKIGKADIIKKDCEEELARVQPILDNAEKAARSLNSAAITEIKGFKKPPPAVKLVVESLCYIFKV